MTEQSDTDEGIVFDTEPLVAYFCDEPGSDTVETYIDSVLGSSEGYISTVNCTELHYIVHEIDTKERADAVMDVIEETGIRLVDTSTTWRSAADFKSTHPLALGDAFALATAKVVGGTLLVGADSDFDEITDIPIEQFRADPH